MAVPLNRIPQGLLDFFGIKSGEWGPRELGQVLQPVMELGGWYENVYALDVSFTATAVAANASAGSFNITASSPAEFFNEVGSGGGLLVPQGERWLILEANIGWSFSAVAGASCDAFWIFNQHTAAQQLVGFTTSDAAIARLGSRSLPDPFWVQPGHLINANHGGILVGGGIVTPNFVRLRLIRFKI